MDEICGQSRFWSKIFEKSKFLWKFAKISILILIFGKLATNFSNRSKFFKNLDFGINFRIGFHFGRNWKKISILVEIFRNLDFARSIQQKFSIWSKFKKNLDFGRKFRKSRFWSKFPKISILIDIFEKSQFWSKYLKTSILVEICEKSRFWLKLWQNLDFGEKFRKSWISKISMFDQICKKLDFGRNFRKISIFGEIFEKSQIWSKFSKNCHFVRNLKKKFRQIFRNLEFGRIFFKNLDFGRNFRKSQFWSNFRKSRFCFKFWKQIYFGRNFLEIPILPKFWKNWFMIEISEKKNFDFCQNIRNIEFGRNFF